MNRLGEYFLKNRAPSLLLAMEIFSGTAFAIHQLAGQQNRGSANPLIYPLALLFALGLGTAIACLLRSAAARLAGHYSLAPEFVLNKLVLTLSPALLLLLDFIQEKFVLRDISGTLLVLSAAGALYLQAVFQYKLRHGRRPGPVSEPDPFPADRGQRRRTLFLAFIAGFTVYSFILLSGIPPTLPFTGDEPHYLLISKSMVRDHDIDLYNNYLNKEYWEFYPGLIRWHAYPGPKQPERYYSQHFPALPLLLVPAYWGSDRLGGILPIPGINRPGWRNIRVLLARETMVLLTALLAALFFQLAWEFTASRRIALYSWLFFAFTPPLISYSQLIFSEIPVALILLLVLRQAVFRENDSCGSLFWCGAGIAALPWFGIKYIVPAAVMLAVFILAKWKARPWKPRRALFLLGPIAVSAVLFLVFLVGIFGSVSPYMVYLGATRVTDNLDAIAVNGRGAMFTTALSYFLDQRLGLFIYSPLYFLFVPGIILALRKRKKAGLAALTLAASYWGFCTIFNFRGGYGPPGRALLPVIPILALFVAASLAWAKNRLAPLLFRILAVLSLLVSLLALARPLLFYHEGLSSDSWNADTTAHVLTHFSTMAVDLTRLVPNLVYPPAFSWPVLLAWLAIALAISLVVLNKRNQSATLPGRCLGTHASIVLLLSVLAAAYCFFNVRLDPARSLAVAGGTVYFQDGNTFAPEPGGFWTRGHSCSTVVLRTPAPVRRLRLDLTSLVPVRASVRIGRRKAAGDFSSGPSRAAFMMAEPVGIAWQGGYVYLIRIDSASGFQPGTIEPGNPDRRFLGFFVRLFLDFY